MWLTTAYTTITTGHRQEHILSWQQVTDNWRNLARQQVPINVRICWENRSQTLIDDCCLTFTWLLGHTYGHTATPHGIKAVKSRPNNFSADSELRGNIKALSQLPYLVHFFHLKFLWGLITPLPCKIEEEDEHSHHVKFDNQAHTPRHPSKIVNRDIWKHKAPGMKQIS